MTIRQERKSQGLCPGCGSTPVLNKTKCSQCLEQDNQWAKERKKQRREQGYCICGKKAIDGYRKCEKCLQYARNIRISCKEKGICLHCNTRKAVKGSKCKQCRMLARKRYEEKLRSGVCTCCNKPAEPGKISCLECMLKHHKWEMKIKKEVFEHYGGCRCACCGEDIFDFLTIDHINNDGAEFRRNNKLAGSRLYRWLRKTGFPPGHQVLCYNCNCAKGRWHNKECPCKQRKS